MKKYQQLEWKKNMGKFRNSILAASVAVVFGGCASSPDELSTTYVSPLKYKGYDCNQIIMEMDHVSKRTTTLYQNLDKKADNDAVQMGIGLVLFWPTLFLLEGGDGPEAKEYSDLKGEFEALRTMAIQKKCGSGNLPRSPEEIIKEKAEEKRKQNEQNSDADF